MEQVISVVGFSLGASLGMGAVRAVTGGLRPSLRGAMRAGIRAWDAMAGARDSLGEVRDEALAERPESKSRARRQAEPRKIEIART